MKAVLLAGGRGTRISRYIEEIPKCCLPIGDKPLIRITVELLLSKGIKVAVCTGYKQEIIYSALKNLNVTYFYNPFYKETNSLGTLWFAKDYFDEDMILMNADVYFDKEMLNRLILADNECSIAADSSKIKTGDYFFKVSRVGSLLKYGKELPLEERTHEYVGIAILRSKMVGLFKNKLISLIDEGKYNLWWENVLYNLSETHKEIKIIDFNGVFWSEVDYYDEYLRILKHTNNDE